MEGVSDLYCQMCTHVNLIFALFASVPIIKVRGDIIWPLAKMLVTCAILRYSGEKDPVRRCDPPAPYEVVC